jgi:hypothetical protein
MQIKLTNISRELPQKSWVSMGLPKSEAAKHDGMTGMAKTEDGRVFRACVRGQELFVEADLRAGEYVDAELELNQSNQIPFRFSDWVIDQPEKLLPRFTLATADGSNILQHPPMVFWTKQGEKPISYFTLDEENDVRKRFFFHTVIGTNTMGNGPVIVEGWIDVFTDQDIVPIIVRATWGTVASSKTLNERFGRFTMITGEKPVIDFRKAKGLQEPVFRADVQQWETELSIPRVWWKSRVIECFGALLCLPPYEKIASMATEPDFINRFNSLKSREQAPIAGMADVWENNWLSFLKVPEAPLNLGAAVNTAFTRLVNRYNTFSDEYAMRDYAQPPSSGQTGSQPDFGASRGELVVTAKQPWALWDYRFSVQAWMLRPYAHKEADGTPLKAKNHPNTKLYNLSIDSRFGTDHLGWPTPVPYNEFWTGSDGQHRTDNLLYAMWLLTRDPSIKMTLDDLVQCSLMELKLWKTYDPTNWTSIETPRGWGRPLLSLSHLVSLGYGEMVAEVNEMVDVMYKYASLRKLPKDGIHTVRTLSNNGFKYGWVDSSGKMIRAWVCWEETIAAIGLYAAYRVTGNLKALELALEIAETVTRHGFFKATDNRWYSCYCVRWDTNDPGKPLPDSAYRLSAKESDNLDLVVYGMHQWMLPALRILLREAPNNPVAARAREIVNFFGVKPANFDDACWWAVV